MSGSYGILRYGLFYAAIAILTFILREVHAIIGPKAAAATAGHPDLSKGTEWLDLLFQHLPHIWLIAGLFGLIAYSVFRRQTATPRL